MVVSRWGWVVNQTAIQDPTITGEMMNVRTRVEKMPDVGVLRELIGFATERLVEMEVGPKTGATLGARSPDRLAQRNG